MFLQGPCVLWRVSDCNNLHLYTGKWKLLPKLKPHPVETGAALLSRQRCVLNIRSQTELKLPKQTRNFEPLCAASLNALEELLMWCCGEAAGTHTVILRGTGIITLISVSGVLLTLL